MTDKAIYLAHVAVSTVDITVVHSTQPKILEKVEDQLKACICHFAFLKKDSTIREAFGTLKPELLPPIDEKQEADNKKKAGNINLRVYYDVEASGWRSFSIDRVIALF